MTASKSVSDPPDPERTIRVLLVDDHVVVRQRLRTFLELQYSPPALPIEVVGEVEALIQAISEDR